MELFKGLLELLKSLIWPGLILGLLYWWQNDIRTLMPRLKKVGPAGAEFADDKTQIIENVRQSVDSQNLLDFDGLDRTPFMAEVEKSILRDVNLVENDKRIPLLARHLAQSRLEVAFERVYSFIFGSQIDTLRKLKTAGGSANVGDAHEFFDAVKKQFPDFYAKSSFGEWFSYLSGSGLAVINGSSVRLTPLGDEFLTYIDSRGLPTRMW
jgi:hypothetical protein